ncbi:LysR family transcriptional regulator [Vibrio sp. RE86]|uniref:LysR family transcriptional regulator n=1 Tax=Vibrio sp. RE86 TaxID=2607605 RepID=UPI001493BD27|nr:LysR family transcriptional regulator [Vibrio sp. RE86]NOH79918.1 LysR family transcriptional regulator [Vibrio sp. RE86]
MKSDIDLNLLVVLVLLNEHRQLKLVAKALGKTESAVSKYLSRLREQLNDPLFVRGAHEYEPTDYMNKLLPLIASGLDSIQTAMSYQQFDPLNYDNTIVLAIPSALQYRVGSDLLVDLLETFPKARIKLVDWEAYTKTDIIEGRVDMGVFYFNEELPKSIYQHDLGRLTSAIVTRQGIDTSNIEDLLNMPYLLLNTKGRGDIKGASYTMLKEAGIELDVRGIVDNLTCLLTALKKFNYATILHDFGDELEGLNITPFPESLKLGRLPKVVANYRVIHRGNPFHELLASKVQTHLNLAN